jgi:hypothetical protein
MQTRLPGIMLASCACVVSCGCCRSFDGFELFTSLDSLVLDKNELSGLQGMPKLATVKTLSFNNNNVEDMALFLDGVGESLPGLDFLSVMRNPASPPMIQLNDEDVAAATRHRLYVTYRLPRLGFLDAAPISAAERTEGAAKGKFLVTRRAVASAASAATTVAPAAAAGEGDGDGTPAKGGEGKGMSAYLGIGRSTYDGKHSEGNRFIVNDDL